MSDRSEYCHRRGLSQKQRNFSDIHQSQGDSIRNKLQREKRFQICNGKHKRRGGFKPSFLYPNVHSVQRRVHSMRNMEDKTEKIRREHGLYRPCFYFSLINWYIFKCLLTGRSIWVLFTHGVCENRVQAPAARWKIKKSALKADFFDLYYLYIYVYAGWEGQICQCLHYFRSRIQYVYQSLVNPHLKLLASIFVYKR